MVCTNVPPETGVPALTHSTHCCPGTLTGTDSAFDWSIVPPDSAMGDHSAALSGRSRAYL
jgi:hypothetical protein